MVLPVQDVVEQAAGHEPAAMLADATQAPALRQPGQGYPRNWQRASQGRHRQAGRPASRQRRKPWSGAMQLLLDHRPDTSPWLLLGGAVLAWMGAVMLALWLLGVVDR